MQNLNGAQQTALARVGVVIIGRNEGERLRRSLNSVSDATACTVYVDSGSTDDSVAIAQSNGVIVLVLDQSTPLGAARSRNEGFRKIRELQNQVDFVQFVDGDCELVNDWLDKAYQYLSNHDDVAIVCGRLRERDRYVSVYHRLCDMEWHQPAGVTTEMGGIFMVRTDAFETVGGFNPSLLAGEESEMCLRIRRKGWKLIRLKSEMARHDAAMTRFSQWWTRSIRNGYAYATGSTLHGRGEERHWARQTRSNWLWGLMLPLSSLALLWPTHGWSLLLFVAYPLSAVRIARYRSIAFGNSSMDSLLYGLFCMLGKIPQSMGQIRFWWNRLQKRAGNLIEYKK